MKFNKIQIVICLIFCGLFGFGQQISGDYTLYVGGENYRIHPSQVTQSEVFIVNSPVDDDVLFASCNTLTFTPFFVSEGVYVTTNGGDTWYGSDTCSGEPIAFHGGDPGIAIDKNGTFIITRLGRAPLTGLYSHYSTDQGLTWSSAQVISTDDLERASVKSDVILESQYYGRTYAAWVKFAQPYPVVFSYTDDGGQSWSQPLVINSPPNRSAGGDLAMGPDGEVYACWAGVTDTSPFKEILVGVAKSTNGGVNWSVNENALTVNGITGVLPEKGNIRVNGLPAIAVDTTNGERKGWVYIVTGQKELPPAGNDPDIVLYRSTDQGVSWSNGIRVNQDDISNGKIQYFPSLHVDRFGAVNVIFYDDRNTTSDSTGVFLARSQDGGDSWKEYMISDHHFRPQPIGGLGQGYQGDNIDVTSTQTTLWPVWMDNSTGLYQLWTAPLDFSTLDEIREASSIQKRRVKLCPNPASEFLYVNFHSVKPGIIRFKIFNGNGKLVYQSEKMMHTAGPQSERISLVDLPAGKGIYFLMIETGESQYHSRFIKIQ